MTAITPHHGYSTLATDSGLEFDYSEGGRLYANLGQEHVEVACNTKEAHALIEALIILTGYGDKDE